MYTTPLLCACPPTLFSLFWDIHYLIILSPQPFPTIKQHFRSVLHSPYSLDIPYCAPLHASPPPPIFASLGHL